MTGDIYTHGHHEAVVNQHARRTAEESATFLLPHLRTGQRLLDVGCGPGTITSGLAKAVAPGEVVGIEVAADVLVQARAHMHDAAVDNVTLEEASVYELPYDDDSFDVSYAHQVLQHLTDPVLALGEMKRVTRPGGVVAIRDVDYGTMTWAPDEPILERWLEIYHAVANHNGAQPDAGRHLLRWFLEAGYEPPEMSAIAWVFYEPQTRENWGDSWALRSTETALADQAVEYGISTHEELARIADAWREWARKSDACFTCVHVSTLGWV